MESEDGKQIFIYIIYTQKVLDPVQDKNHPFPSDPFFYVKNGNQRIFVFVYTDC